MDIKIIVVVAVADNNVIGNDGDMPWRLSTDLKRFKALTHGKPMIMGRKTFESIGKPLPGRTSIVVTRDISWQADGVVPVQSIETAISVAQEIAIASKVDEICIVGGGEIYGQVMDLASVLHVTKVHGKPEGDTVFPEIDGNIWKEISRKEFPIGEKDTIETTYFVYERIPS